MGLFGKKKVGEQYTSQVPNAPPRLPELPDLPPLRSRLSEFPQTEQKIELSPLPSFPATSTGDLIARQAVKQAIRESEPQESNMYEPADIKPRSREVEEEPWTPPISQFANNYPSSYRAPASEVQEKPQNPKEVYIRIDKFQEALGNFQKIKSKLLEIENLLKDLREVKSKEEFELQSWEKEIQEAKAKLNEIDNSLFQRI